MRYIIQLAAMLGDIIILVMLAILWRELGRGNAIFCLIVTALTYRTWRSTGGFIAWTPSGIRAFLANAKRCGL